MLFKKRKWQIFEEKKLDRLICKGLCWQHLKNGLAYYTLTMWKLFFCEKNPSMQSMMVILEWVGIHKPSYGKLKNKYKTGVLMNK